MDEYGFGFDVEDLINSLPTLPDDELWVSQ